jgi:hypothetical protein
MKIQKKGNQVCLHHAFEVFSDAGTITATLMMNIITNATAMPAAHQPNLVLGRCHKEELGLVVIVTSGLKQRRLSLAKPNELASRAPL